MAKYCRGLALFVCYLFCYGSRGIKIFIGQFELIKGTQLLVFCNLSLCAVDDTVLTVAIILLELNASASVDIGPFAHGMAECNSTGSTALEKQ